MIIGHKQNLSQRPVPAVQFDKFLRLRFQKHSIIQSQSQPIFQKVQRFQQLLKLTKSGAIIPAFKSQQTENGQVKNKGESSKTITLMSGGMRESQGSIFQEGESDEAQMKRLNKMVDGVAEWEGDKERRKGNLEMRDNFVKNCHIKKKMSQNINGKENVPHQSIMQRKQLAYSSCEGTRFRKFYQPQRKQEFNIQQNQFLKTSAKLNYPTQLLQWNLLSQNTPQFRQLKTRIRQLEVKARNQYGIKFDKTYIGNQNRKKIQNDEFMDDSEDKENQEFTALELGSRLAKQIHQEEKRASDWGKRYCKDDSVPKSLIDCVQSRGDSFHRQTTDTFKLTNSSGKNRTKLKKTIFYRPKSFKPTFTYIKI